MELLIVPYIISHKRTVCIPLKKQNAFKEFIDPDRKTSIEDNTYDVVLCCAGFFDGLIPPSGLKELARITKPNGLVIWNVATDEEFYECTNHAMIVDGLVAEGVWTYAEPPRKIGNLVFTDCGSAFLRGYDSAGLSAHGLAYIMKRCQLYTYSVIYILKKRINI